MGLRIQALHQWDALHNAPAHAETMVEHALEANIQLQKENLKHLLGVTSEGQASGALKQGRKRCNP